MKNFAVLAVLTWTCTVAPARAESDMATRVEAWLAPIVASRDFNGLVRIARGEDVLAERFYGRADWDLDVPLTAASRFRIASITKTFTGAAVAMLAGRGKLSHADPVSKFIPGFPQVDRIQIRHLLLHASGVPNPSAPPCGDARLDDLVAELSRKPLDFEPGTKGRYSNGGYALLARIVEAASGKPWDVFLREEIFVPLKLDATAVDSRSAIMPQRARGFVPGPGPAGVAHVACEGAWAAIGGGSVVSSAADLHRWGRSVRNETLFKRSTLEHPYGWGVRTYHGKSVIEQSGIINGFSSYLAVYLDEELTVVVLTNIQSGMLTDVGKGLAAIALGKEPGAMQPSPESVPWTPAERRRWVGRFRNDQIATVELSEVDDALFLRWADSPETLFVASTGPSRAHDRQDAIGMELKSDGSSITMRWSNGDVHEFKRLPPRNP
jgi:CubicO group peptidase (beta-lactamase class C family)